MKKLNLILICSLLLATLSCEKEEENSTYPIELELKMIDLGEGIITYTKDGVIETPKFSDDELINDIHSYQFPSSIIIKSYESAQFIYTEEYPLYPGSLEMSNAYGENLDIEYINDSIFFSNVFMRSNKLPSYGEIRSRLIFPSNRSRHVDYHDGGMSGSSMMMYGHNDFSELINSLGENDTLSFINYSAVYELK